MSRRGENIYKRKDGRWEGRFQTVVSSGGNKKYQSVYGKTYREVKEKLNECLINATLPNQDNNKILFKQVAMQWLSYTKPHVKESTYLKYKTEVENHILPEIGNVILNDISKRHLAFFTEHLMSEKNLSKTSVNNILIISSMILRYAEEEYNIHLPKIQLLKTDKQEMRVLSTNEQKILLKYLAEDDNPYHLSIILAMYTGMRIGEICALQWEDVEENVIHINKTMQRMKSGEKTEIIISSPKTITSKRDIPISVQLIEILKNYRQENGYVVCQESGKYIEPRLLQQHFKRIIQCCNIPPANFHSLRHTFATRCVEVGVDVKTLSEILGHSDVKTTLNKYVHSSFKHKQEQMNRLNFQIN